MPTVSLPAALEQSLRDTLSVEEHLPIQISVDSPAVQFNLELLQAALLLESQSGPGNDDRRITGSDLARVEAKADLLLVLMARMIMQSQPTPADTPCRLSASGIVWSADPQKLAVESKFFIGLYISPLIPIPIWVPARLRQRVLQQGNEWLEAEFHADDKLRSEMERWIFLRHRRKVHADKPQR